MRGRDYKKIQGRAIAVIIVLTLVYALLGFRIYTLQLVEGDQHNTMASRQTAGSLIIQSRRGLIYDRQMRLLASNQQVPSLMANPRMMTDEERAISKKLAKDVLNVSDNALNRLDSRRHFVWLKRRIDPKQAAYFKAAVDGIVKEKRPHYLALTDEDKRFYPNGTLAAPLLGFTNTDLFGRMGVEMRFNEDLQGTDVKMKGLRDPSGKVSLESLDFSLDVPTGNHLVLTIDKTIQYVAERVIQNTIEEHEAKFGIAIVMETETGNILAMAQAPTFNPNAITKKDTPNLHNFAVEWIFEPNSTLKPFIIAAALDDALFIPEDKIYCGFGKMDIGPNTIHDSKKYGHLSVSEVISKSSNIGITKIGMELGAERIYKGLTDFGFAKHTKIDLPAETRGILAKPDKWYPIELATICFGQGMNTTSVQLVTAMNAIANGGLLMRPKVIDRILNSDGEIEKIFEPEVVQRAVSEKSAKLIADMLLQAASKDGTGFKAQIDGCPVAGKTGTAEKLAKNKRHNVREYWTGSFAGFLPADNPKLTILVVVDEPMGKQYYGGDVAAPAFRQIAMEVAPMMGVCTAPHEKLAETDVP